MGSLHSKKNDRASIRRTYDAHFSQFTTTDIKNPFLLRLTMAKTTSGRRMDR